MIVSIPKETYPDERRVALAPATVAPLTRVGMEVVCESAAGVAAGFSDDAYVAAGARIENDRDELFRRADVILQVRAYGANPDAGRADLARLHKGQVIVGYCEPLTALEADREMAATGATLFAMELVPRITRAQSMDALSSQATLAGYKAVIMAAELLPRMFPMLMTAAGTISPARVLVIGAGVAGLQAIATARRLGAVVHAYDVRAAVKEQVESLGAKFLEIEIDTSAAEGKGGYAKELAAEQLEHQRRQMAKFVADNDVVITTAAVPGRPAPRLITADMVTGMAPGSILIDLAAEQGGNCELTRPRETVEAGGVRIVGPVNLPSMLPYNASQTYAKNVTTFLLHIAKKGELVLDGEDEITRGMMVCRDGAVVHPMVLEAMKAAGGSA